MNGGENFLKDMLFARERVKQVLGWLDHMIEWWQKQEEKGDTP